MRKSSNSSEKGFYRHPGIEGFVTVKEYIFKKSNGKKYLLLRMRNDASYHINSLSVAITQFDSTGRKISTIYHTYTNIHVFPNSLFAPGQALHISDDCVDFKVRFIDAVSGDYRYEVRGGKAIASYDKRDGVKERSLRASGTSTVTKSVKVQRRAFLAFIAFLAAVTVSFGLMLYFESRRPPEPPPSDDLQNGAVEGDETSCHPFFDENTSFEI